MAHIDDLLRNDPDAARCWREVVTREDPLTLDGVIACYGDPDSVGLSSADIARAYGLPFEDGERSFEERTDDDLSAEDRAMLSALRAMHGTTPSTAPPRTFEERQEFDAGAGLDPDDRALYDQLREMDGATAERAGSRYIAVPESLVRQVEESYSKIAEYGFVTDDDMLQWLKENGG